jgi:hypothetical protein
MHLVLIVQLVVSPGLAGQAATERRRHDVLDPDVDILIQIALDPAALPRVFVDQLVEVIECLFDPLDIVSQLLLAALLVLKRRRLSLQLDDELLAPLDLVLVVADVLRVLR